MKHGGVAQLGARLTGSQKVRSSILLVSTSILINKNLVVSMTTGFLFFVDCYVYISYFDFENEASMKGFHWSR